MMGLTERQITFLIGLIFVVFAIVPLLVIYRQLMVGQGEVSPHIYMEEEQEDEERRDN